MSEVKKRRMIYLKVEPKSSSPKESTSIRFFQSCIDNNNTAIEDTSGNDEHEILYNFDSDDELTDNPLKFSRSSSPANSSQSCKSDNDIYKLKDDLQQIANDPNTCTTTMNTILEVLNNYFPWLPGDTNALKNKTHDETDEHLPNTPSTRSTFKTEQSTTKDQNIQYVMLEKTELDGMKNNIKIIMDGQTALLKEFKSFRTYRPYPKLGRLEMAKFELPFNDLDAFMKFDKELLTDQETKDQLIQIYMAEVEFDPKKYIKKNLRKLFSSDLALKFSFHGRQGNICAAKSNTIKILRECTHEVYSQSQCSNDFFERCATNFFYYVKDKISKAQKLISKRNLHLSDVNTVEFVLPFNEIEAFKSFDASLLKDPELAQQLKLMYLEENVVEYKRFLLNNFKKMFTNDLADQFTFTDKQSNLCIRDFNVIKIMKSCFLEKYSATNENNFFNCAKQYLIYVKQKTISKN